MSAKPEAVADDMLSVIVDDVEYKARKGAMIIEVTDENDISVPRFCYHKKLPVAANCRMCMVQVEMGGRMAPKPLPACATPVADGMKVWTQSDYARKAQRAVMEFLLINHPLDCPICDQGGECELQDVALEYGRGISRFTEKKRVVPEKNFGPLIASDMTRCIHCTRCVRFLEHVAGFKELGGLGRGENVEIGTCIQHNIESELSGNIIDVCPVGALTSRPFRFSARAWELEQTPSIAAHDCVGSNIYLHTRRGKLMRVVPRENEAINEVWATDRDRFAYQGINSEDRLGSPMVKRADGWQEVEWEEALHIAAQAITERVKEQGADQLGMLASPGATLEELALFNQLAEGLGVSSIDHRLRQTDFTGQAQQPVFPFLGQTIEELEQANAILVVGGNLRKDQPIIGHRIRKAAKAGASVMMINPVDYPVTYKLAHRSIVTPSHLVQSLSGVAAALLQSRKARAPEALQTIIEQTLPNDTEQAMAATLADADNATVLLGLDAAMHPAFSTLRAIAVLIGELSGAKIGFVSDGANSAGACLAGVLPHRSVGGAARESSGMDAGQMIAQPRKNYLLLNIEPEYDCANGAQALAAMQQAGFVVALTPYVTDSMRDYADVLLPVNVYAETSGTFVNVEGRWQSFVAASRAPGDSRPGWKVLRVLGNLLDLDGFDQVSSEQVRDALSQQVGEVELDNSAFGDAATPPSAGGGLERIATLPMYAVDNIVRRAESLQLTPDGQVALLRLNPDDAAALSLAEGDRATVSEDGNSVTLEVVIDKRVAKGAAVAPQAIEATLALGAPSGTLQVKKG
ncbi:NADH dehydrogenase subunit G [Thiogranum longum]|uniref:NADH-quinone oxidoreductase n=1 Tax=Thiogranum longum TaxID=1537524 RepID=A0A4R1HN34_9GAMM|nr:NADH-quinone oxidoreductase subunit NuoG [Thiogranum longum]TCK18662.1 NADH dehydrogenase subunit G [Thiogranum longum]